MPCHTESPERKCKRTLDTRQVMVKGYGKVKENRGKSLSIQDIRSREQEHE